MTAALSCEFERIAERGQGQCLFQSQPVATQAQGLCSPTVSVLGYPALPAIVWRLEIVRIHHAHMTLSSAIAPTPRLAIEFMDIHGHQ